MPPKKTPAKKPPKTVSKKRTLKPSKPARQRGQPTTYREKFNEQVERLCLLGATDKDIAAHFDVTETTINNWKIKHPKFFESIKAGKAVADMQIASKLFNRAEGAVITEQQAFKVKTIIYDDNGKKEREFEEVKVVEVTKELPPDTTAAIFWLKNRKSRSWRDKHEHTLAGENGQPIKTETTVLTAEEAYARLLNGDV